MLSIGPVHVQSDCVVLVVCAVNTRDQGNPWMDVGEHLVSSVSHLHKPSALQMKPNITPKYALQCESYPREGKWKAL